MTRETLGLLDLPWDLVVDIIFKIPATYLSRLLFTCKRLNALFKDEEFIKNHSDKAAKQYMVLMKSDSRVYSMDINLHGIHDNVVVDPQKLLNLKDFHNISQRVKISNIFHCDGLLLCTTVDLRLVVWNPCTGQIRWIPLGGYETNKSKFFLGYENNKSCQGYKILLSVPFYRIYDFGSHSWRNLYDVENFSRPLHGGVSLKGNTYWIADKEEDYALLSFNFSTEKFRWFSIPFSDNCFPIALAVVREERLSVLYSNFLGPPKIEIWITTDDIDQTKDLSWSKFLSVETDENSPRNFPSDTTFFIDEEKQVAVLSDVGYKYYKDMVYIVGEGNRYMTIPLGEYRRPLIYNYVPSLVQIQQVE